jgi:hypothetical protein
MEQREPIWYSTVAAPFRFVKGIFRRALRALPLTDYTLRKRDRDKEEFKAEMSDVLRASGEMERRIGKSQE